MNKAIGDWLKRNKWRIIGVVVIVAGIVYLTDRFGG